MEHHYPDAIDQLRAALTWNPESVEAHNNLGHRARLLGRMDEAVDQFRQALAIEPAFARRQRNLRDGHEEIDMLRPRRVGAGAGSCAAARTGQGDAHPRQQPETRVAQVEIPANDTRPLHSHPEALWHVFVHDRRARWISVVEGEPTVHLGPWQAHFFKGGTIAQASTIRNARTVRWVELLRAEDGNWRSQWTRAQAA